MELEANRARLDVADAGEQNGGKQLAIGQPTFDPGADLLQQPLARRVFEEPDEGLDVGMEADGLRIDLGLGGGDAWELGEKTESTETSEGARPGGHLEEGAPFHG